MWIRMLLICIIALNLVGCATAPKKITLQQQIQQYELRISELERELQQKDGEVVQLEKELAKNRKSAPPKAASVKKPEAAREVNAKNIQLALKNANLYNGPLDGKIGANTKKAIKEFQRLNGLNPDGVVGNKTWGRLSEFLY